MKTTELMIVEDEGITAMDLESTLSFLGYHVLAVVDTGEAAVKKAAELKPDLILMDINLKGAMDGIQAAQLIQAELDIAVIYLTAYADPATLERAKITAPYGYILKPFEERELYLTIEMALHRRKLEQRLQESEIWLSTMLNSIGDAVIATDAYGRIKFLNPVAEALTGWSQAEAWGEQVETVFKLINGQTRQPASNPALLALEHGRSFELEDNTLLITRTGQEISIDDSAAPIRDEQDDLTGVVVIFRDITVRKEVERQLQVYALELQARNEELDAFAHTVAHDLKNPIFNMIGLAQILVESRNKISSADVDDALKAIEKTGHKMHHIIEELLLLAGVNKTEVQLKPLNMTMIINEARHRLAYLLAENQAEFIYPDEWPLAQGQSLWVEEVWVNYISNAIKYGGEPPKIEAGATVQDDGFIAFWVQDNGSGLSSEAHAKLFTPFTRLDQVRASGHGLGLSIVRRIVEKLGGTVGIESQPGTGSRFYFTLPAVIKKNDKMLWPKARAESTEVLPT